MLTQEEKIELYEYVFTCAIGAVWTAAVDKSDTYENKINSFLDYLKYLLEEKKAKLVKGTNPLDGTIGEQLELYRKSFPSEEIMNEKEAYWWYTDDCPAGIVWLTDKSYGDMTTVGEDGKFYYWTD